MEQKISHQSVISRKPLIEAQRHKGTKQRPGSAIILVVMLITLLAVIGAMFLLRARVERITATAIQQDKELSNAADTVVALISQKLILDTPGVDVDANGTPRPKYYDYPDADNPWLANLEPYYDTSNKDYRWQQIRDITGYLKMMNNDWQNANWKTNENSRQNVPVALPGNSKYIDEYPKLTLTNGSLDEIWADADGDGIADSKWIELTDINSAPYLPFITTSRGEPVYAAIRVVDNGGMLNVNTGYKFAPFAAFGEPAVNAGDIDGSSQMQVNFLGLSGRDNTHTAAGEKEQRLLSDRNWNGNKSDYEWGVIWQYGNPRDPCTPYDISDELKLRNRYLLDFNQITTRMENLWTNAYDKIDLTVPVDDATALTNWKQGAVLDTSKTVLTKDDIYDFRHISTTYNIDRIINPYGERMVNIRNVPENDDNWAQWLYSPKPPGSGILLSCINPASPLASTLRTEFAQIAANIKDYSDNDTVVTTVTDEFGKPHYGYERPDIRISELVYADKYLDPNHIRYDPCDPNCNPKYLHRSYAIEISKDFGQNEDFSDWRVRILSGLNGDINTVPPIPLTSTMFNERGGRYFVAIYEDPCAPLSDLVHWKDSPADEANGVDPNVVLCWDDIWGQDANGIWSKANMYDVYFGTDSDRVNNADSNDTTGIYQGRQISNCFKPFGPNPMQLGALYFWRIAGVSDSDGNPLTKDGTIIDNGQPRWSFRTWFKEPNSIILRLDANSPPVFGPGTIVRLERQVPGKGFILVDMLPPLSTYRDTSINDTRIPLWLCDPNKADENRRLRTFQRDLTWQGRMRRLWQYDANDLNRFVPTLGWWNNFDWQQWNKIQLPVLQVHNHQLHNVGELGFIFKKSAYCEDPCDRINLYDTELDISTPTITRRGIKVDINDPNMQRMFEYLTVMDPHSHGIGDLNEVRVQGRININTAPWYVLAQLPWVSIHDNSTSNYDLAKAIVAYRDKSAFSIPPSDGLDYSGRGGILGFENIGQLNNVIWNSIHGSISPNIHYFGKDGIDQRGFPDLSTNRRTKVDGYIDDQEERDLIFARISDLVTVRSDVFTAYILVRLGTDGPQKRVMAILDRSGVRFDKVNGRVVGNVKIRAMYPVPDAR